MWSRAKWLLVGLGFGLVGGVRGGLSGCGAPCKDRVAELRAMFAGLSTVVENEPGLPLPVDRAGPQVEEAAMRMPTAPLDLPRSASGVRVEPGVVLVLRADGTMYTSLSETAPPPALAADVLGLKGAPTRERPLLVAMESGAPLRALAQFVSSLAELSAAQPVPHEDVHIDLLTYPTGYQPASEDAFTPGVKVMLADYRGKLREQARRSRADPLGTLLTSEPGLIAPDITCSALLPVYDEWRIRADGLLDLLKQAPRIIEEDCGCRGVDVEGLAAWMWLRYEAWSPVVRGHAWSLGPASAEVVEFKPDATVQDLLAVVDARAGRPFRMTVPGPSP